MMEWSCLFTIQEEMETARESSLLKRPAWMVRHINPLEPKGDSPLVKSAHLRNQHSNDQIIGRGEYWGTETVSESGEVEDIQNVLACRPVPILDR